MRERWRYLGTALWLAAIAAAAGPPALGDEGRIPIWQPTAITAPGSYVVTRDISAASGPILDIQVGDVRVDLNGHTLSVSSTTDPVITLGNTNGNSPTFELTNGRILGGSVGISAAATINPCSKVSDLTLGGQAMAAIRLAALGDLEAKGIIIVETRVGIDLIGPSPTPDGQRPAARIRDSTIHADVGISCDGVLCSIQNNSVYSCGSAVRLVMASGSETTGNVFDPPGGNVCFNPQPEPPGDTLHLEGSASVRVTGNTLRGSPTSTGSNHGITADAASHDAFIADNLITGFGDDGMHLMSSHNLIRGNVVNRNGGNGIWLSGNFSLVDDNKIGGNTDDGIVFLSSDNIYRGNTLLGNASPASGIGLSDTVDGGGNIL